VPEYARFENLHETPAIEDSQPLSNGIAGFNHRNEQNTMIIAIKMNHSIADDNDSIYFVNYISTPKEIK
jgi:hypothetical protein